MSDLVDTRWLARNHSDENLRILDATWYLPDAHKDGACQYQHGHIPGAQFFDLDAISDQSSALPHMLPSADQFARAVGALGIGDDNTVVIYDQLGLFSAPRIWWMFKLMGHDSAYVLDGGLPKWIEQGHPLSSKQQNPIPCTYRARADLKQVAQVADLTTGDARQILDARPAPRFEGLAPEPRPNTRSGHIPGSVNLCYREVLNPDGTLKKPDLLRQICARKGIDINAPIILSCGSGVTAAVLWLALIQIGADQLQLYDGSWAEWGARHDLPIAIGES